MTEIKSHAAAGIRRWLPTRELPGGGRRNVRTATGALCYLHHYIIPIKSVVMSLTTIQFQKHIVEPRQQSGLMQLLQQLACTVLQGSRTLINYTFPDRCRLMTLAPNNNIWLIRPERNTTDHVFTLFVLLMFTRTNSSS
jgi:hypothetical protein